MPILSGKPQSERLARTDSGEVLVGNRLQRKSLKRQYTDVINEADEL